MTDIKKPKRDSQLESLFHSEHTVVVEKLAVGGRGVARIQFQDKPLVVFIQSAVPGEKVKIRISSVEKNHLEADILQVIERSPSRLSAPCDYYSECGGCNWQHIAYEEQIRQKELILLDLLKKFVPDVTFNLLPTIKSDKQFGYRNRIQLKHEGDKFGYFRKNSHEIVEIEKCLIADPAISDRLAETRRQLKSAQELKKYEFRINQDGKFEHYRIGTEGEGLSFSQVNNSVNDILVSTVVSLVQGKNPDFMTELYAGAGNFTFPILLALPDVKVESVELNGKLTAFANEVLKKKNLQKRLVAFTSDCESFAARRQLSNRLVLLDPPRAGCSAEVLDRVIAAGPESLIYVSCHPVFLARDLKKLTSAHGYTPEYLQIFDMFPQTDHFETLVLLSRQ